MYLARFAVAKTKGTVAAAEYLPGGAVVATAFTASLMIARKLPQAPTTASFVTTGQDVPAFNVLDEDIEPDTTILLGQTVDELWVVHCVY